MMAGRRTASSSCRVFITSLVTIVLLSDLLSAGPIDQKLKGDVGQSVQQHSAAQAAQRRLVRHRRNISWYKQNSDFWNWYKYFTDNNNMEAVQELDKIYLAYLQNKNRAEGRRSYKAYLRHLGDVYKSCADSADPNCVASATTRPTPKPEPPKPPPVKTCDPTKDTYCLYAALVQGKSPYLPLVLPAAKPAGPPAPMAALKGPAPAKAPAPLYVRSSVPVKDPQSGYYYYAPTAQSFLTKEQKAELLRICQSDDVECLQYHMRAAYGHKPSAGPLPSYAHLGCDPKKDPGCGPPKLVQKAPSGMYLQYPNCDPLRDPLCAYHASLAANRAPSPPSRVPGSCNPLFEDGCNPLTATRFSAPPQDEPRDEAAAIRQAPPPPAPEEQAEEQQQDNDPYAMLRDAQRDAQRDPYARYRQPPPAANDPYARYRQAPPPTANDPYARYRQPPPTANDPYAMYRQAPPPPANDPYAMFRQAPPPAAAPEADPNDPYAMYRQAPPPAADPNDPYAMYRQAPPPPAAAPEADPNDPYAMYRQAPPANDPYAMYRQAPPPPANDQLAMLRQFMANAQVHDPSAPRSAAAPPPPAAPEADPNDPFAMFRQAAAAMHRRGPPPTPPRQQHPFFQEAAQEEQQQHHPLGPPGKTKEGHDCYIGYDRDCLPVKPAAGAPRPRSGTHRGQAYPAEAYEPHVNADGSRSGVLEPDNPHCDPEYDRDCRLRRYEPSEAAGGEAQQPEEEVAEEEEAEQEPEPFQSGHQEEPFLPYPGHGAQGMPSFQDILRGYGDQFPEQDDHRAYGAHDYRKK